MKQAAWLALIFLPVFVLSSLGCDKDSQPIGGVGASGARNIFHVQPQVLISHLPKLYEPFTVRGTFTALQDQGDSELWISVGVNGVYLDGEHQWHGPLKKGDVKTLTATFAFVKGGNHTVLAHASSAVQASEFTTPAAEAPTATDASDPRWQENSLPVNLYVTEDSQRLGLELIRGSSYSWKAGDPPRADAGVGVVVTDQAVNASDVPRIEFVQGREDIKRLQEEGLLPAELRYQWRAFLGGVDFSKKFVVVYFDALWPEPGHLAAFEGSRFQLEDGMLRGNYRTYSVPPDVPRANRPVSAVELRAIARRENGGGHRVCLQGRQVLRAHQRRSASAANSG